jgi:heme exporter protein C
MTPGTRLVPVLLGISAVMFAAAPYVIDTAPYESTMGLAQRIFYFHFPAAIVMLVSALICGGASARYLAKRTERSDYVAVAAAELAIVFGTIVLITGPLWARKSWGVWWDWEPRLTSTVVLWLISSAYLLLRRFAGPGSEVMAAALGLFGAVLVPFVYWSVNFWRTLHPKTTVLPSLPSPMMIPALFCLFAFLILYVALMLVRIRLESSRAALERTVLLLED